MPGKALVLAGVPVLALCLSACGGGGVKLYDANATYRCLTNRPERIVSLSPTLRRRRPLIPFLLVDRPVRIPTGGLGFGNLSAPVTVMTVLFYAPVPISSHLGFFGSEAPARTIYRSRLSANTTIERNVLTSWELSNGTPATRRHLRSIVLGCLRTA